MANKIEIVIEASDKASTHIKALGGTLNASGTAAAFAATAYDKTAATANRLQLVTLQLAQAQKVLASETDPMKQAALRVEIDNLAKAQDTLQRETQESTTKLVEMGEAHGGIKVLGLSLTDLKSGLSMVMGAAQKAGQAVQAAFDYTQRGAAIQQTTESFERLGISIESLRDASLGTVDDMTLMRASLTLTAGASETLQQHLLGAAPQLLEIAKAANALNPTLGDTAFMYESIATGIKRASPMILDNLGIVVNVGKANEDYARQLGKTVEALTADEKAVALLNATMEAGDRLIQQAGGNVESYTDAWAQLQVEITNTKDALAAQTAEGIGPLLARYADFLKATRENEEALIGVGAATRMWSYLLTGSESAMHLANIGVDLLTGNYMHLQELLEAHRITGDAAADKTERMGAASKVAAGKVADLNDELERERDLLKAMQNPEETHRELISRIGNAAMDSLDIWKQYERAQRQAADAANASANAAANQRRELELATAAADRSARATLIISAVNSTFTEDLDEQTLSLDELRQKQADTREEIDKLNASQGRAVTTWSKATQTEAEAALTTLQLADAQAKLAAETDPLKAAQLAVKVEDLQGKLGGASEATTTFIDNSKKVGELTGVYDDLQAEIDAVTAATYKSVNAFMFQQMVSRMAADGWSDAELAMLDVLGQAAGIDTTFIKLAPLLDDAAAGVADIGTEAEVGANKGKQLADIAGDIAFRATEAGEAWSLVGAAYEAGGIHGSKVSRELRDDALNLTSQFIDMGNAGEWGFTAVEGAGRSSLISMADIPPKVKEIGDAAVEVTPRFVDLAGVASENLGTVEGAARSSASGITLIGDQAVWAQQQIDKMHGKDLTFNLYTVEHRAAGAGAGQTSVGNPFDTTIPNAEGGDYYVNSPTHFVAGEAGAERAIFIPKGEPGYDADLGALLSGLTAPLPASGGGGVMVAGDGGTRIGTVNLTVNGTADASETARLVMREFQDRGFIPRMPLR